ncbi:MAG: hypothetical protein U9P49_08520 [Thermodesulfobacteriota bacterium]|nr:hypothetical protein [Thermodesulfobacteriota bacterium]
MDSYLIRIYRREKDNPEAIVGTIEEIGTEERQSFKDLSELSEIITLPKARRCGQTKNQGRKQTMARKEYEE